MCKYCDEVVELDVCKLLIKNKDIMLGNSIFTNELYMEMDPKEYTDDGDDHFYLSIDAFDDEDDEFASKRMEIKYCPFCGVDLKVALLRRIKEEE